MNRVNSHKDLEIWNKSMDLVMDIYSLTKLFPSNEKYELSSQPRRAAVSVPSNISEGASRNYTKDYCRFLFISLGSLSEIETQILIAERLGYIRKENGVLSKLRLLN